VDCGGEGGGEVLNDGREEVLRSKGGDIGTCKGASAERVVSCKVESYMRGAKRRAQGLFLKRSGTLLFVMSPRSSVLSLRSSPPPLSITFSSNLTSMPIKHAEERAIEERPPLPQFQINNACIAVLGGGVSII